MKSKVTSLWTVTVSTTASPAVLYLGSLSGYRRGADIASRRCCEAEMRQETKRSELIAGPWSPGSRSRKRRSSCEELSQHSCHREGHSRKHARSTTGHYLQLRGHGGGRCRGGLCGGVWRRGSLCSGVRSRRARLRGGGPSTSRPSRRSRRGGGRSDPILLEIVPLEVVRLQRVLVLGKCFAAASASVA